MSKISLIFVIFFIGTVFGIIAQTSSRDFYVNQQQTSHLGNYSTWDEFERATNTLVKKQRQNMISLGISAEIRWVKEPTRMESELVNRAYRELPNTTRIGSAYLIQFMPNFGSMIYNVYIYSDSDDKRNRQLY